jgi:hypothetical protein
MVYLSSLLQQWPWNGSQDKHLEDKEIYSHIVPSSETSNEWEIPLHPCLPGFAYVGIRMTVLEKDKNYSMYPRFVLGKNHFPLLGHPWDIVQCTNGHWTPLSYPMVPRLLKQPGKGSPTLLIAHNSPCFGKVELLAQKFDDLLEDDSKISYAYYDPLCQEIGYIHTPDTLYSGVDLHTKMVPSALRRVKILPPIQLLLRKPNLYGKNEPYQLGISIKNPL